MKEEVKKELVNELNRQKRISENDLEHRTQELERIICSIETQPESIQSRSFYLKRAFLDKKYALQKVNELDELIKFIEQL